MQPFRVLEHTADIGFEAFGRTPEEVFSNAARAFMNILVDLETIAAREEMPLEVVAPDPPSLLVNWLSELLYLFDAEGWLFSAFEVRHLDGRKLSALARGEKFDPARHRVNLLVKAITYHQLSLQHRGEFWRAQVYVDI